MFSQIPIKTLTTAYLAENDWGSLTEALKTLNDIPIFIEDDKTESSFNLIQNVADMCRINEIGLVVMDGLYFEGKEISDAAQILQKSYCFRQLNQFSIRCNIPVIVTSSLRISLANIERDIPSISDVSPDLVDMAALVMMPFFSRESWAEYKQPENASIAVLKSHSNNAFCVQTEFNSETGSFIQKKIK